MRRASRAYARPRVNPGVHKTALPRKPLDAMLATCTDGLLGVHDRALLLFAWPSNGRSAELSRRVANVSSWPDGASRYVPKLAGVRTGEP